MGKQASQSVSKQGRGEHDRIGTMITTTTATTITTTTMMKAGQPERSRSSLGPRGMGADETETR